MSEVTKMIVCSVFLLLGIILAGKSSARQVSVGIEGAEEASQCRHEIFHSTDWLEGEQVVCQAENSWTQMCHMVADSHNSPPGSLNSECSSPVSFQSKKAINRDTYKGWNHLLTPDLTNDGAWAAYTAVSASGTVSAVMRSTQSEIEFQVPRGVTERGWISSRRLFGSLPIRFTFDSKFALFSLTGAGNDVRNEIDNGKNSSDLLVSGIGIFQLETGVLTAIPGVSSFKFPKHSGAHVAYLIEKNISRDYRRSAESMTGSLVLRNLITGKESRVPDVTEYIFDPEGKYLAYIVKSVRKEMGGVYVTRVADGYTSAVVEGFDEFRGVTFDNTGNQIAFLAGPQSGRGDDNGYSLYYSASPFKRASVVVPAKIIGESRKISVDDGVEFNRFDNALTFRTSRAQMNSHVRAVDPRGPRYEIWSWRHHRPLRQDQVGSDEGRSAVRPGKGAKDIYLAVYHIAHQKLVELENESTPDVLLTADARYAVGVASRHRESESLWGIWEADLYLIDALSGNRKLLRHGIRPATQIERMDLRDLRDYILRYFSVSPDGKYAMYFDDRRWWSIEFASGRLVDVTGKKLPRIRFGEETYGSIAPPVSQDLLTMVQPIAGWTRGDRRVLLYGDHDIWEFDPSGKVDPVNLTAGFGKKNNFVFRLIDDFGVALDGLSASPFDGFLERDKAFVDTSSENRIFLMTLNRDTMSSGMWSVQRGQDPKQIFMLNKRVTPVARMKASNKILLTVQSFSQYPDLWVAKVSEEGSKLNRLERITNLNPQQIKYRWGSAELVKFISDFGVELDGVLYKPEDFDLSKKYPMVVSIYQKSSRRLHMYGSPDPLSTSPSGSLRYPWVRGVSQGYVWFVPDVRTAAPYPGPSAVAAVAPAVQAIIDRGFIDPGRICLTGHSFGAFEVNYVIARTDIFRCAVSDAGPNNMLSWYGTDQFGGSSFLENEQGALGGSIWDRPYVYFVNSPLLFADHINTPLLMMHNDGDIHPPMSQGLEFFNALRRNGKMVYLFNYYDEGHGLRMDQNIMDWDRRVTDFLAFYLKDGPKPEWMSGRNQRH